MATPTSFQSRCTCLCVHCGERTDSKDSWNILYEHSHNTDEDRVARWNTQMDALLVYAGLFSAVVAGFITSFNGSAATDKSTTDMSHPLDDSSLWLASLIIALAAASLATLVKQWLLDFIEKDFNSTPRENLLLRQHRTHVFMHQSSVPVIISALPVLLRIAFLLFLAGLVVELCKPKHRLTYVVASLVGVWIVAYTVISILPCMRSRRAYKSPESLLAINIYYAALFLITPLSVPFPRTGIRWRDWREIDRADVSEAKKAWRDEQELEALVSASTILTISQERFAWALRGATEDYSPARAMKLVNSIASQVSYTLSSTRTTTDWKDIWNPEYIPDTEFQGIAPHGTAALLDIVVDRVLATPTSDDHPSSSDILGALACIAILLPYHTVQERESGSLSIRLSKALSSTTRYIWGSTYPAEVKDDIAAAIFRVLCLVPKLCDQPSLRPMPQEFAEDILHKATLSDNTIFKFIFASQKSAPGVSFYVALRIVELARITPGSLDYRLTMLVNKWLGMMDPGRRAPIAISASLACETRRKLEGMSSLWGPGVDTEALGCLTRLCDFLESATT